MLEKTGTIYVQAAPDVVFDSREGIVALVVGKNAGRGIKHKMLPVSTGTETPGQPLTLVVRLAEE